MKHLYCAGKIGNATKDKLSGCIGLSGKGCEFHQRATFQSPSFTFSRKCAIVVFFVRFFSLKNLCQELQVNSHEGNSLSSLTSNWVCKLQLWYGDWNGLLAWLQTLVNFPVSKETPTMKIYRGETAQVHRCLRITQDLRRFSCLSDHTTYMQTSTVMNLLCVYVCI